MTNDEKKELKQLCSIPILENELMWICRVVDGDLEEKISEDEQSKDESL